MAEIVLDKVTKRYPDGALAVHDFNLEIADGEFIILVGPSGCGKSTTLNMIAGLEDITSGELRIDGQRVNDKAPKDRDIAMVFQSYALYPHMTVRREHGASRCKLAKVDKATIDAQGRRGGEDAGADPAPGPQAGQPVRWPAPAGGDGPGDRAQPEGVPDGRAAVQPGRQAAGADAHVRCPGCRSSWAPPRVYVTHDQTEAMTLGDRVVVMRGGVVQQVGSPQYLYDHPANLFVAGFIGSPVDELPARRTLEDGAAAHRRSATVPLPDRVRQALEAADAPARA